MDDFLSCMRFCCQSRPFPAEKNVCVQSLQQCLNFHLVPRLFPEDGKFGVYFKIGTDGDIRTTAIIGRYTLYS